jgi:hypothetical protein
MVRYFYAPALAHRVVVEVDIGAFVEAMMRGVLRRRGDVVVDICEAIYMSVQLEFGRSYCYSQRQEGYFALRWRHRVSVG